VQPLALGLWPLAFFREDFRGDAAVSSFVNLRFGRSRFLCCYERAYSHIPMLCFGMRAPRSARHAQRQKRACRGPRFERALALRSVGMARVEGMGGHHTDEHGNTRFNCGSATLGHVYSVVKDRFGEPSPARPGARAHLSRLIPALQGGGTESINCCQNAVRVTAL